MTARYYNFTKQNGVVMKARNRFTKQNGVVKRILSGWTKTNGVVEQVYSATRVPAFCIKTTPNNGVHQLFVTDSVYASAGWSSIYEKNDYWADGAVTELALTFSSFGFNYANGVANEQSILFGFNSSGKHELLLSSPGALSGQTLWGYGMYAIFKVSANTYVNIYKDSDGMKPVYISPTMRTKGTVVNIPENQSYYSQSLTLYNGRGVVVGISNVGDWGIYDFDESTTDKLTFVGFNGSNSRPLWEEGVYTPNGQDCLFILNEEGQDQQGYTIYTPKLYKYNTQTRTISTQVLSSDGWPKRIIGTYNGYIFVAGVNTTDMVLRIEKYNLSLSLVGTHDTDVSVASRSYFNSTSASFASGNKFACVKHSISSQSTEQLLVFDLSLF